MPTRYKKLYASETYFLTPSRNIDHTIDLRQARFPSNLSREHAEESPILMKFGINVVSKNVFNPYFFFLSTMINVEGVKSTLKVHILLNISEMIQNTVFCINW